MTDLIVRGTKSLSGAVKAPSSKSFTHRAVIAASLSEGRSTIKDVLLCDDTSATIEACRLLGAKIKREENGNLRIDGCPKPQTPEDVINCRDSASTMRFLAPVCALAKGISVLTGGSSLRMRPMGPALSALMQLGVLCYSARGDNRPPLIIFGGGIAGGEAVVKGDVSSQFVSGLLFASPLGDGDSDIVLSAPLESKPYVEMTIDILKKHGLKFEVHRDYRMFHVPCKQIFKPSDHVVEGDYSSAAFLLAAAVVTGSSVKVTNLNGSSVQGDRAIIELLSKMGARVKVGKSFVEVQNVEDKLRPVDVDLSDNPDLIPAVAVVSCLANGRTTIRGVKRLQFKESNREGALLSELTKMGAKIKSAKGAIQIEGVNRLKGAQLDSHGDHRIAMACAVAGLGASGTTTVRGVECVNKSYPNFVGDIISLGADAVER